MCAPAAESGVLSALEEGKSEEEAFKMSEGGAIASPMERRPAAAGEQRQQRSWLRLAMLMLLLCLHVWFPAGGTVAPPRARVDARRLVCVRWTAWLHASAPTVYRSRCTLLPLLLMPLLLLPLSQPCLAWRPPRPRWLPCRAWSWAASSSPATASLRAFCSDAGSDAAVAVVLTADA